MVPTNFGGGHFFCRGSLFFVGGHFFVVGHFFCRGSFFLSGLKFCVDYCKPQNKTILDNEDNTVEAVEQLKIWVESNIFAL